MGSSSHLALTLFPGESRVQALPPLRDRKPLIPASSCQATQDEPSRSFLRQLCASPQPANRWPHNQPVPALSNCYAPTACLPESKQRGEGLQGRRQGSVGPVACGKGEGPGPGSQQPCSILLLPRAVPGRKGTRRMLGSLDGLDCAGKKPLDCSPKYIL